MDAIHAFDGVEAGRQLGHDFFRFSRLSPGPDWPRAVREGFDEAASRGGQRRPGDRFERKWLQLRLGAWQRQRVVADDVSPDLLRTLDVDECPVTREPLTHGRQADTDWSVDRLNNDGGYAPGNLAVMSVRANRAKGSLSFEEVLAIAESTTLPTGELTRAEWLRLAVLMEGPAFATRQHLAPLLPLVAPLPCRSVRLAIQQIQRLFTVYAGRHVGKNALVKALSQASLQQAHRMRLRVLGDAVHEGLKHVGAEAQCWDVWLQPRVMDALRRWRESLDAPAWTRAAQISGQLSGGVRVTAASLVPWQTGSRGYYPAAQFA